MLNRKAYFLFFIFVLTKSCASTFEFTPDQPYYQRSGVCKMSDPNLPEVLTAKPTKPIQIVGEVLIRSKISPLKETERIKSFLKEKCIDGIWISATETYETDGTRVTTLDYYGRETNAYDIDKELRITRAIAFFYKP